MSFLARFDPGSTALWMIVMVILEVTVVVLASAVIAGTASRRRAAVRHRIWICTLACTLMSPAAVAISEGAGWTIPVIPSMQRQTTVEPTAFPKWREPRRQESERPAPIDTERWPSEPIAIEPAPQEAHAKVQVPFLQVAQPAIRMTNHELRPPDAVPQVSARYRTSSVIIGALIFGWGFGVVFGLGRFALGWLGLGALKKSLRPFEPGERTGVLDDVRLALDVTGLPPLATSDRVSSPVTIGFPASIVVFPQGLADTLTPRELRDILIHECAHVLRHDILVGLFQRLAAIVYWPHPLVHSMNSQLSRAREEVCDNYVLRSGDPCQYARTLLDLTERCRPGRVACAGVGLMDVKWTLSDRIAGLLDPRRDSMTKVNRRGAVMTPLLLFGACLAIAGIRPIGPRTAGAQPLAKGVGEAVAAVEPPAAVANPLSKAGAPDRIVRGVVVDEAGRPVSKASVGLLRAEKTQGPVETDADGKFAIAVHGYMLLKEELIASANDGALQGAGVYHEPQSSKPAAPVRLTVKPSRSVVVHVRDQEDKPVAGAAVEALSYEYRASGKTEAGGDVTLRIAADAEVRWIIGLKAKTGFDYYENYREQRAGQSIVLPAEVTLVLDGARTTVIKAVDSAGMPVPNISFCPWTIFKPGKIDDANIGGSPIVKASTDKNGLATFDWLPSKLDQGISFLTALGEYSCPARPRQSWEDHPNEEVQAKLLRNTPVRGTVRFADGRPAPGILLAAEGRGAFHETCTMRTRTAEDGTYSMGLYPDQSYMIGVIDGEFAARSLTGIIVREGKPQSGLDLTLSEGTLLQGRITKAPGASFDGRSVTITEIGELLPVELSRPQGEVKERVDLVRRGTIDADGRYRFRIGPGHYKIWGPDSKATGDFTVENEKEIVRDVSMANEAPSRSLKGVAVEESATGDKAIPGALVEYATIDRGRSGDRTLADDQGAFQFSGVPDGSVLVYVRNKAGTLAGFTFADKDSNGVRAAASKASHVRGRVVDQNGRPLVSRQVRAWFDDEDNPARTGRFSAHSRTDAEGRYDFSGMPVGSIVEIMVPFPSNTERGESDYVSKKTDVIDTNVADVPDLAVPTAKGRPVVPKAKQAERMKLDAEAKAIVSLSALPSRAEMEAIVKGIGRDPVTPELIDRAWLLTFPEFRWSAHLEQIKTVVADTGFLQRMDEVSQAVTGHPADTLAILRNAIGYHVGDDMATLKDRLKRTIEQSKRPVSTVRGKVVEAGSGKPITGALVYVSDALARTDASGAFLLKPLSPQPNGGLVWVRADGYATSAYRILKATGETVDLQAEMSPDQPIVGLVVDPDGKPIAGAGVWAMIMECDFRLPRIDPSARSDEHRGVPLEVLTDSDGRFSFRGLPDGFEISWYRVRHPEYQSIENGFGTLKAGEPVAIRLEPGCKIAGSVVDELGRPVSSAMVDVRSPGRLDQVFRTFTTADGQFRFGGVAPGRWTLVIQPEENAPAIGTVVAVAGRPVENQYVVGPGVYIVGKVVGQDGKPVSGATVGWAQPVDERGNGVDALELGRMTGTAENGSFRLGPLSKQEYQLTGLASEPRRIGKTKARSNQADVLIRIAPDSTK